LGGIRDQAITSKRKEERGGGGGRRRKELKKKGKESCGKTSIH